MDLVQTHERSLPDPAPRCKLCPTQDLLPGRPVWAPRRSVRALRTVGLKG